MVWTWTEIISLALVRSGLIGLGQVVSASLMTDGKKALSLLLDEWDGAGLALPNFSTDISFTTQAGRAQYLLGPGSPNDVAIRPETIVTGTCTIASNPITRVTMAPMSYPDYTMIPVPSTQSQPYNYAVNETFPQMQVYLYPTPAIQYPITLTCKVKWSATVGWPDLNPFAQVEVPSGYVTALVDNLALKLAENYRLETSTLQNKAKTARSMVSLAVAGQNNAAAAKMPIGLFSWNIITAGRNP
jgi:hypothetical protein